MLNINTIKICKSILYDAYIFVDNSEDVLIYLDWIASEYNINLNEAEKICDINHGKNYYSIWLFPTENDAISALMMLKLMR